jgi:squalene cyclase
MNTRRTAAAVAAQRNQQGNLPNNRTDPDGLRVSTSFEGVSPPTSLMGLAALAVQDFSNMVSESHSYMA